MACHRCQKMFRDPQRPELQAALPVEAMPRIGNREKLHLSAKRPGGMLHYPGTIAGVWRDKEGYDRDGFDKDGFNRAGYDRDGYDREGFNKEGYNRCGLDREGLYTNGFNQMGLDMMKNKGLGPDGLNIIGYDSKGLDADGYDFDGYKPKDGAVGPNEKYDRAGYDPFGYHLDGHRHPFFTPDADGIYADGYDIYGFDREGYNEAGYDRWGFDREGYNKYGIDRMGRMRPKDGSIPNPPPPVTPKTPLSHDEYLRTIPPNSPDEYNALTGVNRTQEGLEKGLVDRYQTGPAGRVTTDPLGTYKCKAMKCPHCGQFIGGKPHYCPNLIHSKGQPVAVFKSGAASIAITERNADGKVTSKNIWIWSPYSPEFNPDYAMPPCYGFSQGTGRDPEGYDIHGYDENGYNRAGYDREGFDRNGYDSMGYDRNGVHRDGHRRPNPLAAVRDYLDAGTTLLDNQGLVDVYSRLATSLAREPRRVILVPGGGFSTDLKGTIQADPTPLGEEAPDRHNLICTKAGIGHELGHEVFTPQDIFARIIEITTSDKPIEGLDEGRRIVKTLYNVIEDGRIERAIGNQYPGIADALFAQCSLMPRWDERVGESVGTANELIGAMLYTALPCFKVKPEVRQMMTPKGQELLAEFEPIIDAAVRGEPEDVYYATLYIAKRLEEEGLLDIPDMVDDPPRDPSAKPRILPGKPPKGIGDQMGGQQSGGTPVFWDEAPDPEDSPDGQQQQSSGKRPKRYEYVNGYAPEGGSGGGQDDNSDVEYIPKNDPRHPDYQGDQKQTGAGGGSGQQNAQDQQGDQQGGAGGGQKGDKQGDQTGAGGGDQKGDKQGDQTGAGGGDQKGDKQGDQTGAGAGGGQKGGSQKSGGQSGGQDSGLGGGMGGGSQNAPGGHGGGASGSGTSGNLSDDVFATYGATDVGKILDTVEESATSAIIADARRRAKPDVLGKRLHAPLGNQEENEQVYRSLDGLPERVRVRLPRVTDRMTLRVLEQRRAAHQKVARDMAATLKAIRQQTEKRLRNQIDGRLDRRRMVAAVRGSKEIHTRIDKQPETSLTASVDVDLSGSMSNFIDSGALFDAAMTLSDTFDALDMPHEVRAFGSSDVQLRAMKDQAFDMTRASFLATGSLGGTELSRTASLSVTSLLGRQEANKLMVVLSDGQLWGGDHEETCQVLEQARKNGVVTFGIFLEASERANPDQMNQLYGVGNWAAVKSLEDFPRLVAGRIAQIFKSLRPRG